jgi:hypothetical protein
VRLSHELALRALSAKQVIPGGPYDDLVRASFGSEMPDEFETKLRVVLNKLHLLSLKANFELFLNRFLSTIWNFRFTELSTTSLGNEGVSLRELAEWSLQATISATDVREFIIDKVVARYGLRRFVDLLKDATLIHLPSLLNREDYHYWPQIQTVAVFRGSVRNRRLY